MGAEDDELKALNRQIADRENARDGAWFDRLLAPEFAMRRASRVHVDRSAFLGALTTTPAGERNTDEPTVLHRSETSAFVVCTVSMKQSDGTAQDFRNYRLFSRPDPGSAWQLLGWVNEPA